MGQTYRVTPWRYNEDRQRYEVYVSVGKGEYQWEKGTLISCLNCDKPVARRAAALNKPGNGGRFCSYVCYKEFRDRRYEQYNRTPRWCKVCGTRFMAQRNAAENSATCDNPVCRRYYRVEVIAKENLSKAPTRTISRVHKPCAICGKEIVLPPSLAARRKTCSVQCGVLWKRKQRKEAHEGTNL